MEEGREDGSGMGQYGEKAKQEEQERVGGRK